MRRDQDAAESRHVPMAAQTFDELAREAEVGSVGKCVHCGLWKTLKPQWHICWPCWRGDEL